ncbi:tyrosine-type recombinase/integrase [Micromonospora sp. ALFpr18c]|uniref:tyrosine-type recombinase/integrase n=1 Tax=Micromonospora sp. ALFpr18c TaxID=1458665 RepID=UPI00124B758C|nr:tyrosine-type recombinase/integrase [Micromonospora sp. ALFpr18c]
MVDLGAGCGLRQGEILGLGVDDIDFDAGWVHVSRQVKLVRSRLVFGLTKNDRDRRVPLPDSVALVLRQHVDNFAPVSLTLPWEDPASDERVTVPLLFTTTRRGAINRRTSTTRAGGRHHADPGHRDARAPSLLRLVAARRGGEHQGPRVVPRPR